MHTYDARVTETKWTSIRLSAEAIKVLAHPLRSGCSARCASDGPATATALPARLETNTGATSYHLRKLAAVGLVEETGEGRGRERWWRPTTEMHEWNDDVTEGDPDAQARPRGGCASTTSGRSSSPPTAGWRTTTLADRVAPAGRLLGLHSRADASRSSTPSCTSSGPWSAAVHAEATAANAASARRRCRTDRRPPPHLLFIHDFPEGERPR